MTLAMQTRCVWCGVEQYALTVHYLSQGDVLCQCGRHTAPMDYRQYRHIIQERHSGSPTHRCVTCDTTFETLSALLEHLRDTHIP